ncbi:tRNA cyclic N6-threonylcarbamoyladenosine(37) synthase TcdA [Ferrimonas lipolytica]|uniref:tRNA threonylcarbamoyladenosine dehydratase n=1 Tax=Ferrimonas lipolytica TaxID=2724191 RepID=A0A6H1UG57_9GAMM|nr:tRNA cyclic N6-threonylcarbamoyladenosine(37) synthase TcdA [Ferrimonas lipolytica]QIZ77808.1 tRNA cyclic N6-threonylcarbamoyladenosine(37) synthase TcdA [Ferrimonas lipolytica]
MNDLYQQRFGGIGRLYGAQALQYFANAHVCIVGIGGVGTWAAEALARSGIGQITLIDLDDICTTNTNRQIHALKSTVGQSKVAVMAERMRAINPDIVVNEVEEFVDLDNLHELIDNKLDYLVDCIDSVKAKTALIAHCKRQKIKIVTVGGAGGQLDPTRVQVADLAKTYQDPLAAKVRNNLRREYNFSKNLKRKFSIECVFSDEPLRYPSSDGEVCMTKSDAEGPKAMDCATGFGAVTPVTGTFGFVAASRVLLKLAEKAKREQQ